VSQIKKFPCLITQQSVKIIGPFYNRAFSIASKHDFDDQFFLLATVHLWDRSRNNTKVKANFILIYWIAFFHIFPQIFQIFFSKKGLSKYVAPIVSYD
jgi:hypothetical protein